MQLFFRSLLKEFAFLSVLKCKDPLEVPGAVVVLKGIAGSLEKISIPETCGEAEEQAVSDAISIAKGLQFLVSLESLDFVLFDELKEVMRPKKKGVAASTIRL